MAKKPLTHSEQMVGRRLPPHPKHVDTVMARFVRSEGGFSTCFRPQEPYLRAAFLSARKKGWIRQTNSAWSFQGSRPDYLWELTGKGQTEALLASERVASADEARQQWGRDWAAARKAAVVSDD